MTPTPALLLPPTPIKSLEPLTPVPVLLNPTTPVPEPWLSAQKNVIAGRRVHELRYRRRVDVLAADKHGLVLRERRHRAAERAKGPRCHSTQDARQKCAPARAFGVMRGIS
jgi:hypothetical protein